MSNSLLMVEDEVLIGDILEWALADAGFQTHRAIDGSEAFAALHEPSRKFCAVITDVKLGGRTNGWQVARHARELHPEIHVIYISGHGENDWRANGVDKSLFLSKPFLPCELVSATLSLVNGARGPIPQ